MRRLLEAWSNYITEGQDVRKVAKVIMVDKNDKVLILKRSGRVTSEESPWEWDLPGGHVEEDESLESALDREVWEETSLDIGKEHDDYIWIIPEDITNYYIGEKYERAIGRITVI